MTKPRTSCDGETTDSVRETVRDGYARIATQGVAARAGGCCAERKDGSVAQALGYDDADLQSLPEGAEMGLSCGNPTALAGLREGETLVDLGSGAGFDVFVASARLGAKGRAIGVDMTPEMLSRARGNLAKHHERGGLDNVEFRLGEIEHLPVADSSVDVVISNCVINLSPDKAQVWREIARILRPGGRVAVSDLALLRPLPEDVRAMVEALVGCVAGAVLIEETGRMVREAGLTDVHLEKRTEYVRAMKDWQDPLWQRIAERLPEDLEVADFVTSLSVTASKSV